MTVACPRCTSPDISQTQHWDDQHEESYLEYACAACEHRWEDADLRGVAAMGLTAAVGGGALVGALLLAPELVVAGAVVAGGGYLLRKLLRD